MKKLIFTLTSLLLLSASTKASHIYGIDSDVQFISGNTFKVSLRLYADCGSSSLPAPASLSAVKIYDAVTDSFYLSSSVSLDSTKNIPFGAPIGTSVCYDTWFYSQTITIPNNSNGYYLSFEYTSLSSAMVNYNASGTSILTTAEFPDPLLRNSTPKFDTVPFDAFFCLSSKTFDFIATDADGDSLVYKLAHTYESSTGGSKPFNLAGFNVGYNFPNLLGPGSSISVNSSNGSITSTASSIGTFMIGIICEEYRAGVKIGEVRRDIMLPTVNCSSSGISMLDKNDLSIYPNPSNGIINIDLSSFDNTSVQISDINGRLLFNQNSTSGNLTYQFQEKGIYLVNVLSQNKIISKRVIID